MKEQAICQSSLPRKLLSLPSLTYWVIGAFCVLLGVATSARAVTDSSSCYARSPTYACTGPYWHHFAAIGGYYSGSGFLPLEVDDLCQSAGCGGPGNGAVIFGSRTGQNGNGYNSIVACYDFRTCHENALLLGESAVFNLHSTTHTLGLNGAYY